ncbi:MAG: Hsp20/alpha crystallin family protein [Gallionella sp.]|jgi:HSP20 family protein
MTTRDLLPFGKKSVSVTKGGNPIIAFQDEVNKLFHDFFGDVSLPSWFRNAEAVSPAMDVAENEKEFKVTAELPGLDAKNVHITAADGYVTIKGEKKQEEKEERAGYFRQERSYGSFQRVVSLPDTANFDKAEASFKNGVLTLSIPKKAGAQSKERTIEVKQAA